MNIPINSISYKKLSLRTMSATDVDAVFYIDGHEHLRDPTPLTSLMPATVTWLKLLASLRQVKKGAT